MRTTLEESLIKGIQGYINEVAEEEIKLCEERIRGRVMKRCLEIAPGVLKHMGPMYDSGSISIVFKA